MASILKSTAPPTVADAQRSVSGLTSFNLQDIVETGRRQLEAARAESDRLVEAAKIECDQLRQQATAEGHKQGFEQGQKDFNQQVQQGAKKLSETELATFRNAVEQMHQDERQWLAQWQSTLVGLVLELTERLVGHRSDQDEQVIMQWAVQAIELTRTARSITMAVHPETLVRLGDRLESLLRTSGAPADSRLEPDETISPQGVIVRQEGGSVDLQLKTQLERFSQRLQ